MTASENIIKAETGPGSVVVKEEVSVICVLCGQEGHMGKDCREVVCILCCARGHLMEQCGDITIVDEGDDLGETTSVSEQEKPAIRLKSLTDLLEMKDEEKSLTLEESVTPQAVPTTHEQTTASAEDEEEEKFLIMMTKKFGKSTPPDVIALFKQKYCGLCCTKFSCEKFARKHYDGRGHESLIRKKTFRNRPLFWQMVFHALISKEPRGATEEEIFQYILDTFSAHLRDDPKLVRAEMVRTIRDMVERFHNVVKTNGVYRLRDRKPSDAPKPVPEGLVEKKNGGGAIQEQKPASVGYSNYKRHLDDETSKDRDDRKYRNRNKDHVNDLDKSRDLKVELENDRKHRREEKDREEKNRRYRDSDTSRDDGSRRRYPEHSRRLQRSSPRRRSRSRHGKSSSPAGWLSKPYKGSDFSPFLDSPRSRGSPPIAIDLKSEVATFAPTPVSLPQIPQNYFTTTPQFMSGFPMPTYSFPTFMTMTNPGMTDTLSSMFLMATQGQHTITPPPTPEEL